MNRLLVALLSGLAVVAFLPTPASAAEPVLPLCVPPSFGNGVCVGVVGGDPCAWYWLGGSHSSVCQDGFAARICSNHLFGPGNQCVDPRDNISGEPVCAPPGTGNYGCVQVIGDKACVWTSGAVHHEACVYRNGRFTVCSNSLFSVLLGPGYHCVSELGN